MADELTAVEDWVEAFTANLKPAERKKLAEKVARMLRHSSRDRIAANVDPDGQPFAPRRRAPYRLRRKQGFIERKGPMFQKLKLFRNLDLGFTPDEASVGYAGGNVQVAQVSQYGLRAKIGRGRTVKYAQRRLLGLSDQDQADIMEKVLAFLDR